MGTCSDLPKLARKRWTGSQDQAADQGPTLLTGHPPPIREFAAHVRGHFISYMIKRRA